MVADGARPAGRDGERTAGSAADPIDEAHLARSRAVWDRWSGRYGLSESDFEPMRETAMDHLDVETGDRVLDVGCGPGVNLERLRDDVGPEGAVVAVDYSPAMVERARDRVASHGWENVTVRCADATSADLGDGYDAAIATLSMSVMPTVARAVGNVADALSPDGRFVVFDLRAVPAGPLRVANPLLRRFFYWFANWNPDGDVLDALKDTFETVDVVETYAAGVAYTALASNPSHERDR